MSFSNKYHYVQIQAQVVLLLQVILIIEFLQRNPSLSLPVSPSPSTSRIQNCNRFNAHPRRRIARTITTICSSEARNNINNSDIIEKKSQFVMSRKHWLSSTIHQVVVTVAATSVTTAPIISNAAETIGKDPECNDPTCLGVWDGLLADCPHGVFTMKSGAGCASSQDDTPGVFAEPWDYSEAPNNTLDYEEQMRLLIPAIQLVSSRRGDKAILLNQNGRYVRFLFVDGKTNEESIGEFYFTPNDSTVQFRVGSSSSTLSSGSNNSSGGGIKNKSSIALGSSTRNLERCELIRKELRYQKVPVLRNRKRALFFVESDFDTFGPSLGAAGEDIDAKMNIDDYPTELLQNFPNNGSITGRGRR